jgi:hypothetical protein
MVPLAFHLPKEALLRGPVYYGWRMLHYLKSAMCKKSYLEGSIAEGYIVNEWLTYFSRDFSSDVETRFNKDERNQDKQQIVNPDEFRAFSDGAIGLGRSILKQFDKEFEKMFGMA